MLAVINKKHILLTVGLILLFVLFAESAWAQKRSGEANKSRQKVEQKKQKKIKVKKVSPVAQVDRNNKAIVRSGKSKHSSIAQSQSKRNNPAKIKQRTTSQPRKVTVKPNTNRNAVNRKITRKVVKSTKSPTVSNKSVRIVKPLKTTPKVKIKKMSSVAKADRNNKAIVRSGKSKRSSITQGPSKRSNPVKIKQRTTTQPRKVTVKSKTNRTVVNRKGARKVVKSTKSPTVSNKYVKIVKPMKSAPKMNRKVVVNSRKSKIYNKPVNVVRKPRRESSKSAKNNIDTAAQRRVRKRTSARKPVTKIKPARRKLNENRTSSIESRHRRRPKPRKRETVITSRKNRKSSLFTRPTFEKRRFTRPKFERSQHITRKGKNSVRIWSKSRRERKYRYGKHRFRHGGRRRTRPVFHERERIVKHHRHHEHIYRDCRNRIQYRIIWPKYRYHVYYNWGNWFTFRYCYPYYHRKYIFVSLNGYWPLGYDYARYYWYGYHPYAWYGYYPVAREIQGDTYNYYTYNYYGDDVGTTGTVYETDRVAAVDHETFADVRAKLAQQAAEEPAAETLADKYFDEGVTAFDKGDYETAAEKFTVAMELAPDDIVLPFAYTQALFANEQYSKAAEVLRTALERLKPEEEGVFFPRGLYPDEEILLAQIDKLDEKAEFDSFDKDLQLLLGYQLLGIGELDASVEPLEMAQWDWRNKASVEILLEMLEKIKAQQPEALIEE